MKFTRNNYRASDRKLRSHYLWKFWYQLDISLSYSNCSSNSSHTTANNKHLWISWFISLVCHDFVVFRGETTWTLAYIKFTLQVFHFSTAPTTCNSFPGSSPAWPGRARHRKLRQQCDRGAGIRWRSNPTWFLQVSSDRGSEITDWRGCGKQGGRWPDWSSPKECPAGSTGRIRVQIIRSRSLTLSPCVWVEVPVGDYNIVMLS